MAKDQVTLDRIKLVHPNLVVEVGEIYDEICKALTGDVFCRFAYTLRTFKEQADLYAIGRTKPGRKVTQAGPGLSMHNYGLAVDIVLIKGSSASWETEKDFDKDGKADWKEIVTIFKQYGWAWGGDWKFVDKPHFEKPLGYSVRELLALHTNKSFDSKGYVLI